MDEALRPHDPPTHATSAAPGDVCAIIDGRYRVEEEIGRGGMGRVHAAFDLKLGRRVAVKLLPPGPHGPAEIRRFEREARAAAAVQHDAILDVHDVGVHDGEPYIVSELLHGATLRERLAAGPLPPEEARDLALQLARGLAAAHAQGVVHRDLKPDNLFITTGGRLKILDFGIAKLLHAARTSTDATAGTAGYMAPEQVRGRPVDARADLFSFGAILYEMLSGRPAFRGETDVETAFALVSREPEPVPGPPDLVQTVERCLRKEPAQRMPSAGTLVALLEHRPPPGLPARKWMVGALMLAVLAWPPAPPRPSVPLEKQIAVLPFRSVGGGPPEQAFCSGLSELLSNKLRQLEQFQGSLRVVPAAEVVREKVAGAREARAAFGATLVLEGSVQWAADRAVVAFDLVETGSQLALASRDLQVPRSELGRLHALLVQKAAEMLELELQPAARLALAKGAPSPAALEFYLQARGYLQRYDRMENLEAALRVLEQALAVDPDSAVAHAARAEAYLRVFRLTRAPDVLALASGSADRAAQLDDRLAPVLITRGLVRLARGDSGAAIESFEEALRADPRSADAVRELANAYEAAGRAAEAEAQYRRAIELRNGSWAAWKDLGVFYNRHGRLAEAAAALERVAALTPDSYSAYSNLGGIYLRLGRFAEAGLMLRRSIALRPTPVAYSNLGSLEYLEGRFAEAAELYSRAAELNPKDERIWGALGDAYRWVPGREAEAGVPLRRALELTEAQLAVDGGNPQLRARRAVYLAGLGEHARARDELERALGAAPRDGFVLFRAALVHQQAGRTEEARRALRAALEAGYSVQEVVHAPPLRDLLHEQEFAQLGAARELK